MVIPTPEREWYFREPRFEMTVPGRTLVRLVSRAAYGTLVALAVTLVISGVPLLRAAGVLVALFLFDRLLRLGRAEHSLHQVVPRRVNIAAYLTPASYQAIELAFERTLILGGDFSLRLAAALIRDRDSRSALSRLDVDPREFESKISEYVAREPALPHPRKDLYIQITQLAGAALRQAAESQGADIEPHDLFAALPAMENEKLKKLFELFNIDAQEFAKVFLGIHLRRLVPKGKFRTHLRRGIAPHRVRIKHKVVNRSWSSRVTPHLDRFSEDLTDLARAGRISHLIGHEKEYKRLVEVLSRPGNPNVLLIGEPGSGKDPIVYELARELARDEVPAPLFDRRLVELSISGLVAGASEGELERRIRRVVDDIHISSNIIVYIPDMHNLMKTSGQFRLNAADVFIPEIKDGTFPVIGATHPREFKKFLEADESLVGRFEVIHVEEMTPEDALTYLVFSTVLLEAEYGVTISFKALKEAVTLARRYFRQKLLPESAEDLLRETVVDVVQNKAREVHAEDVIRIAEEKVNIPIHKAERDEVESLLHLEETIHRRFINQEEAVTAVAQALREYRAGLSRKSGPIASFLFVGPTGVGKTELAKLLAETQFWSEKAMVRLDMSEYGDKQSFYRLIGSPDGSVRGTLTDAIWDRPYSLILLDEFEKSHPDISNLFLQVLDDGRLTDNLDRTVNFENTIIIATSNAHSDIINEALSRSESMEQIAEYLKRRLVDVFKPELLNRFSNIIAFKNLSPADIRAVATIKLNELARSLKDDQDITLLFDEAAVGKIAAIGFDPLFGARPLRKAIEEHIQSALANMILKKEVGRGDTVKTHLQDEQLRFEVKKEV